VMPVSKQTRPKPSALSRTQLAAATQNVSNPNRVIDASTGLTKLELVRYYDLVGELMMAHLRDRPVALLRAPDGIAGQLFFQKHADTTKLIGLQQLDAALSPGHPPMLQISRKQGLLSAAQWNVIEFHTLNGVATHFDQPDRMVFDLDPGAHVPWKQVQEAAELMRAFLLQLGLMPFLKTSGGKGLHVVVPLRRTHDWDAVKAFSHAVVSHMAQTIPQRFVEKSGPKNRVGKVFIDYLRNTAGASTVCAWSARARPGMGISVPVAWPDLVGLKGGDHWTVRTVIECLDRGNAPWEGYARAARGLTGAMKLLGFKHGVFQAVKR
jgi:bifunctional non-homologous end joining protein LigD